MDKVGFSAKTAAALPVSLLSGGELFNHLPYY